MSNEIATTNPNPFQRQALAGQRQRAVAIEQERAPSPRRRESSSSPSVSQQPGRCVSARHGNLQPPRIGRGSHVSFSRPAVVPSRVRRSVWPRNWRAAGAI